MKTKKIYLSLSLNSIAFFSSFFIACQNKEIKKNNESDLNKQRKEIKQENNDQKINFNSLHNNFLKNFNLEFLIQPEINIKTQENYVNKAEEIINFYKENKISDSAFVNIFYALTKNKIKSNDLIWYKENNNIISVEDKKQSGKIFSIFSQLRDIFPELLPLAIAYQVNVKNNKLYKNSELKKLINEIMEDFSTNYYHENQQQHINWWHYEIGMPKALLKFIISLKDIFDISQYQKWIKPIDYFVPNVRYGGESSKTILPSRLQTGANLVDNVIVSVTKSVILKNEVLLKDSILALYDSLLKDYVISGDGFYEDGSFIQHDNVPYIGSYGEVLFNGFASLFTYLKSSSLDLAKNEKIENLYKFIEKSVMPFMFAGSISDGLSGRAIVREGHSDKKKGLNILSYLTVFMDNAPEKYKLNLVNFLKEQLKHWKSIDLLIDDLKKYKINSAFSQNIIDFYNQNLGNNIEKEKEINNIIFTKNQDRYVWKTNYFMFNINLHSKKIAFFEALLGENLEAYYHNDGSTLLHTKNNLYPYDNDYWAIIDFDKIPGISSIENEEFNQLYSYEFPKNKKLAELNETEKQNFEKFKFLLKEKQKNIEKKIKNDESYNNGIKINNIGFIKAFVKNFSFQLETTKTYFMIDNQIIIVGNIKNNSQKNAKTVIANHLTKKCFYKRWNFYRK
ncbi:polysaccharide lyase family 8 super-sandwich domain-containing protein [[Mycoplasma] collis]|uniref:polysaccharide lyase family 8 super-sandwich domain-containing protein n=1 Tax=[Mycoplasma] collis TaxID=2127 RepID=UPI00051C4975|nr:polysaccharide lyase family 8 super-sandwich domain-containing protein [[Mycoplasma] collis]